MPSTHLGLAADDWHLIFGAIQTLTIVIGVPYGVWELVQLRRDRAMHSLEKMLEEWREENLLRGEILDGFPLTEGGSVPERALSLLRWMHASASEVEGAGVPTTRVLLDRAHTVVNRLNDLGSFVELHLVSERHVFAHLHYAILRLTYLLEPYILLRTALRGGNRWGMRLRRLRKAAERYHSLSPLHRHVAVQLRDVTILAPRRLRRRDRMLWGRRLMPSAPRELRNDNCDIEFVQSGARQAAEDWGVSVSHVDEWFRPI